ncbi:Acetyl-CoA synthetase-like protein [Mycena sanguinolenta]|uniref:Acetyl-CoA synthetase-like protein n=1 Tax=Mycena sanguinolenta TaxID=230812 RepID=A0A8H6XI99_9AGAR|nr:Acetyl-CoA synthetase-like protein [Mycena sanguinolenta]
MSTLLPPLDCSLNLSQILEFHIAHENRSTAYSFADEDGNMTEISRFEFSRAAHRVAHLLRPERQGPDGQVLAVIAATDVLIYQTIVAGCVVAGLVPFPISTRNSAAAIFHLLADTDSHRLLRTKGSLDHLVDTVATDNAAYELSIEEVLLLGQIYPHLGHETPQQPFVPYPSPLTSASLDDVAMYLHSSGSTGLPKAIPQTHRNLIHQAAMDAITEMAAVSPRLAVGHLPAFHAMGMITQILFPILNGGTACLYPPASTATKHITPPIPTAENAIENAKRTNSLGIMTIPAMILEWQSSEDVGYLKSLNLVTYAGGPLASRVGDALFRQGVNILPIYGATEIGIPTLVNRRQAEVDAGEWAWFRFNNRVNIRWEPQGDGAFECQFLTVPETHQVSVENLPDVKGYSTKDLFERHPTKPDLYKIVGRLDDVIIMANGEKTVPGPVEDVLLASPFITGAVMFGRERSQVGVLIEPNHKYQVDPTDERQLVEYRNLIWPTVMEANEISPAYAQIYKEMILVTQPAKPMIRAPKGTVIKKPTITLYKQEIESLYEAIEASGNAASDIDPPLSWSSEDLEPWLIVHASLVADKDIHGGRDLFDQGFDSLHATFLRHRIVGALRKSSAHEASAAQKITQNFVYVHPTIEDLASAIAAVVRGVNVSLNNAKDAVEEMIAKYSAGFEIPVSPHGKSVASSTQGQVVLLTGSTGGLGSHILEILLRHPAIERVYAFNRLGRIPVSERQQAAFVDRALDIALLASEKLIYFEGDSAKENLGLPLDVWTTLRDTITVIIHNAWTLNFNKTLASFEPHNWDEKLGPFPEELQLDANVAIGNGYGESKYISERILAASGLQATSFRIGQVCGSKGTGAWSTTEWFPAVVRSCIALGSFPSHPAAIVTWLPPQAVSQTIIDAAVSEERVPFAVNLVHPRPVRWDFAMSIMASMLQLPLIPGTDWFQRLQDKSASATDEDIERIPAIKLLGFIKAALPRMWNVQFCTSKAEMIGESMKNLGAVA